MKAKINSSTRKTQANKTQSKAKAKPLIDTADELRRWYREVYLRSPHWKKVRALALKRDKMRCRKCGTTKTLQVHHKHYNSLFKEELDLKCLVTLCRLCHSKAHPKRSK